MLNFLLKIYKIFNMSYNYIQIINGAGHHVYADKPLEFNDYINYLIEEVGFGESEEISESPSLANILD